MHTALLLLFSQIYSGPKPMHASIILKLSLFPSSTDYFLFLSQVFSSTTERTNWNYLILLTSDLDNVLCNATGFTFHVLQHCILPAMHAKLIAIQRPSIHCHSMYWSHVNLIWFGWNNWMESRLVLLTITMQFGFGERRIIW